MNFYSFFQIVALLQLISAVPIPIPEPEPVIVTVNVPHYTTTVIPVAEVIISDGQTTTIQLTTLSTISSVAQTNWDLMDDNYVTSSSSTTPVTTATTPTITTTTPTTTATSPAEDASSTSVSIDSNGVAHVWVTRAKKFIVNQYGETISTSTQQDPTTSSSTTDANTAQNTETTATSNTESLSEVISTNGNTNVVHNVAGTVSTSATNTDSTTASATEANTSTSDSSENTESSSTSAEQTPSTSSTDSFSSTNQNTSSSSTAEATTAQTSTSSTTTPQTTTPQTTTSSTTDSQTSESVSDYVTTWSNGEVFYSDLPETMVSPVNVAPVFAVTTTTLQNTAEAMSTTGLLSLTSSDSKLLLATLTEGLPKDKNVNGSMVNPQTVAVTNTMSVSSPVLETPSSSSSSSSTSTSTSTQATSTSDNETDSSTSVDSSTTSSSSSASASVSSSYLTKSPNSIVYSPYENDGTCKSYSTVLSDLKLIASKGIQELRVYGNDCNYLTTVLPISKTLGLVVNQGFWISSAGVDSIDSAVEDLIEYVTSGAASYSWEVFSYFTVGNEAIISNYCTVSELISKISEVKSKLTTAGYSGKVTTSEPPVSFENNPELCTDSEIDFVGINPHSYFDADVSAAQAGSFVQGQIAITKQYCGSKDIVVTETGYPNAGNQNGLNIPSAENQLLALQSIFDVVGTDVTILTTFDDYWKNPGEYNIEQHFGMIQLLD